MKPIIVEEFILKEIKEALRLASNTLNSENRETALDRQVDYAERLTIWLLNGKIDEIPRYLPRK